MDTQISPLQVQVHPGCNNLNQGGNPAWRVVLLEMFTPTLAEHERTREHTVCAGMIDSALSGPPADLAGTIDTSQISLQ